MPAGKSDAQKSKDVLTSAVIKNKKNICETLTKHLNKCNYIKYSVCVLCNIIFKIIVLNLSKTFRSLFCVSMTD